MVLFNALLLLLRRLLRNHHYGCYCCCCCQVILEVPWDILREQPGRYVISIARARRRALYTLQVDCWLAANLHLS